MNDDEKLKYALKWIERIRTYDTELTSNRVEAEKYYFSDALGNEVQGRSKIVTSDLADTVEWILPSLVKIFCSGTDVCMFQPRGQEDTRAVELNNELTNYQMRVRNKWFVLIHDFIKDALLQKVGILKYSWATEHREFTRTYEGLTIEEVNAKLMEPSTELISSSQDESGEIWNVEVKVSVDDEYPLIEAVPPHEVGFPKTTRDIDKCQFLYHKVQLYPYEIAKRFGKDKLKDIVGRKEAMLEGNNTDLSDNSAIIEEARFADLGGVEFIFDKDSDKYWVYECYYPDPETGESRKLTLCGDVILSDEENVYIRPPFHIFTPVRLSHRVIGRSMFDIIKELQRLRTALLRQILDNLYFSNSGRYIADPDRVNFDDLLNNNIPGGAVRGDKDALGTITPPQLQPWTFQLLEYIQGEKENRTGVTRYNQGTDGASLNKTARGISAILGQSQQRIELMARNLAETAIAPLINSVMEMNIRFLSKQTMVRICNEWSEITPDNIVGQWDVIVNVGIGTADKDTVVAQMQQLLGIYAQIVKAGVNIATPKNIYNACTELTKAMGFRNTDDFWTDPEKNPMLMNPAMQGAEQDPMAQVMNGGTMPGAQPSAIPIQPNQPGNPTMTPNGGGFYG